MADTAARLAISARRNEVARFTIVVIGIDLTGVALAMQIRLGVDIPGPPQIALATVTTLAAEGLKLDSVTSTNGVTTSIIKGRINASTMTDAAKVPYRGEIGADSVFAYAMQWTLGGDAQTRLYGDFIVVGSAFGSDGAPANRPPSYGGSSTSGGSSSGSLTFGDQVIRVSIDGVELLTPIVGQATDAATRAQAAAVQTLSARTETLGYRDQTVAARDTTITALGQTMIAGTYATVVAANAAAAAGTIPANGYVTVLADENNGNERGLYRRVGAANTVTRIGSASAGPAIKFTVAMLPATGANNAISQRFFEAAIPPGKTSSAGTEDASTWAEGISGGKITDSGGGYHDYVHYEGYNVSANISPVNAQMPMSSRRIETQYRQSGSGILGTEFHNIAQIPVGGPAGFEWRADSLFIPKNYSDRTSLEFGRSSIANTYQWLDGNMQSRKNEKYDADGTGAIQHEVVGGNSIQYIFNKNNYPVHLQANAAGNAARALPYYNNRDVMVISAATFGTGESPLTGVYSGAGYFEERLDATPRAGGGGRYLLPNAPVTGNWTGDRIDSMNVSGVYYRTWGRNTNAGGRLLDYRESAGGDNGVALVNNATGYGHFTYGIRASDGAFVISNPSSGPAGFDRPVFVIYRSVQGEQNVIQMPGLRTFANDAAAASGGIPVKGLYVLADGTMKARMA